ncbi:hypothetical protein [Dongshaea marina]|uniref:hypothetical protein n=1 Tax=Dongshaea marina TaxID=2047966 RepID=UPI000D3E3FBB|nr:hypothetical protein [Dongshaea marina]
MSTLLQRILLSISLPLISLGVSGADLKSYLNQYFSGSAIQFGYGSGTSSNNPRVELEVHYCASGLYYSGGRSCRPNIIAKGYQCTPVQDMGRWQIATQGNQAALQWSSNSSGPGAVMLHLRNDGVVVDPRGNPFVRIGRAQCR